MRAWVKMVENRALQVQLNDGRRFAIYNRDIVQKWIEAIWYCNAHGKRELAHYYTTSVIVSDDLLATL